MKGNIKKLENYPVSVTAGTYVTGTDITIDEVLHNPFLIRILEQNRDTLKRLMGKWEHNSTFYAASKSAAVKGDYWIYTGRVRVAIDGFVVMPNSIIYYDGRYMRPIDFKQVHDAQIKPKYDVCIIGGGAGGIGAAYALRNQGYRVCLVERLDTLGGTHCNAGVGLLIATPLGDWYKELAMDMYADGILNFYKYANSGNPYTGVGGGTHFDKAWRSALLNDPKNKINGFAGNHLWLSDTRVGDRYLKDISEGGIDVLTNYELIETRAADSNVDEIIIRSLLDGATKTICADYFIDCSGNGVLFLNDNNLQLDVDYYIGTDPRDRFNETTYPSGYAGDHDGINTLEPIYFTVGRNYWSGEEVAPYPKYKRYNDLRNKGNFTYQSIGDSNVTQRSMSYSTSMSARAFREKSLEWNYADGLDRAIAFSHGNGSAYGVTRRIQKMLAIREAYRIKCDKMLTTADLATQATSQNITDIHAIALSTWYVDIHTPTQSYTVNNIVANGIPYECMIPACYTNVLIGCRAYGASHLAQASARLAKTMMELGHSAGMAILQLLERNTVREDVREVDVSALQSSIGIADLMAEIEEYFYGSTVNYEVLGT